MTTKEYDERKKKKNSNADQTNDIMQREKRGEEEACHQIKREKKKNITVPPRCKSHYLVPRG